MSDLWVVLPLLVALLALSGFVKAFTALLILRTGVGLHGAGHGFVTCVIALALAVVMSDATLAPIGGISGLSSIKSVADLDKPFRSQLEKSVDARVISRLNRASELRAHKAVVPAPASGDQTVSDSLQAGPQQIAENVTEKNNSFPVLVAAFVITQLSSAISIGLLLILPFIIIDLLVTHVLASLGVTTISSELISFPLKLLLFLSVGGVELVATKINYWMNVRSKNQVGGYA